MTAPPELTTTTAIARRGAITKIPTKDTHRDCAKSKETRSLSSRGHNEKDDSEDGKRDDAFLVQYRGRTYDIRNFLSHHPGGRRTISQFCNRSLDKAFQENPHSKSAFHLLEEFTLNEQTENSKLENRIDWTVPILNQVATLTDDYWEWVNLPVNRPIRLFRSNLLEYLSITPWYFVPIVWLPVYAYFLHAGYAILDSSYTGNMVVEIVAAYIGGFMVWTVMEYLLHRKLFHFKPPANSPVLITLHFLLHGVHHKAPLDPRRLAFPPVLGALVARGLWEAYKIVFPRSMVYFIAAGTVTGYLCYDLTHYYLHHGSPKFGTYLYTMKRSHNYHHFSHHDLGFGVSSRIWDRVFGTDIHLRQLSKPIEW